MTSFSISPKHADKWQDVVHKQALLLKRHCKEDTYGRQWPDHPNKTLYLPSSYFNFSQADSMSDYELEELWLPFARTKPPKNEQGEVDYFGSEVHQKEKLMTHVWRRLLHTMVDTSYKYAEIRATHSQARHSPFDYKQMEAFFSALPDFFINQTTLTWPVPIQYSNRMLIVPAAFAFYSLIKKQHNMSSFHHLYAFGAFYESAAHTQAELGTLLDIRMQFNTLNAAVMPGFIKDSLTAIDEDFAFEQRVYERSRFVFSPSSSHILLSMSKSKVGEEREAHIQAFYASLLNSRTHLIQPVLSHYFVGKPSTQIAKPLELMLTPDPKVDHSGHTFLSAIGGISTLKLLLEHPDFKSSVDLKSLHSAWEKQPLDDDNSRYLYDTLERYLLQTTHCDTPRTLKRHTL